jgi:hypothetical protein
MWAPLSHCLSKCYSDMFCGSKFESLNAHVFFGMEVTICFVLLLHNLDVKYDRDFQIQL